MQKLNSLRYIIFVLIVILFGFTISSCRKEKAGIWEEEKVKIGAWIKENDLNPYGDSKDTVYTGGTPLFNEKTAKMTDKYEYILRRHPDRPWLE